MKAPTFVIALIIATLLATTARAQTPQLSVNDPIILSDTHGYDFTNYLDQLVNKVRTKWYSAMPDSARQGQKGRAVLIFTVFRDGTIQNLRIVSGSETQSLDEAASSAVQSASPFGQLPADFSDNQIVVQFAFLYNQR
jgi:TonB family protein